MTYNSDHFDLSNWNLTLPVDSAGGNAGLAYEVVDLKGYESQYFYDSPDGAMTFVAMADGATTSGTHYARSELREMIGDTRAFWNLNQGGTMTATLKVDQAPLTSAGTLGKLIVGQIHGKSDELVRLYWDNNTVYFHNDQAGANNSELKFTLTDAQGKTPNISLGEKFSYMIDAHGDTLTVKVYADGDTYSSVTKINPVWQTDTLYFKAGVYLGINETNGSGTGQTSFYGLDFSHTQGEGLGGLEGNIVPAPTPDPVPIVPVAIDGTSGNDTITATHDNNLIHAGAGDDTVYGRDGDDVIYGEDGNDTIDAGWDNDTVYGGAGNDVLLGSYGDDVLSGGPGNDTATGGDGHDTFIVAKGDGGLVVTDFTVDAANGDKFVAEGFTSAELSSATLAQSGADAVLSFADGTQVTFQNVSVSALTSSNLLAELNGTLTGLIQPGPAPTPDPTPTPDPVPTPTLVGTAANDTLNGTAKGNNVILAGAGNDKVTGHDGMDRLYGEDGNDTLYGYWNNDTLYGGAGNDKLFGGNGNDTLYGGSGDNSLSGEAGDDTLAGGGGADTVSGGAGHDTFIVSHGDASLYVADFTVDATNGDRMIVKGYTSSELAATVLTQSGSNVIMTLADGAHVTFHNVKTSQLTSANLLADVNGALQGLMQSGAPSSGGSTGGGNTLVGTSGDDTLDGRHDDNNVITGQAGNDKLTGHDGVDQLYGDDGNDTLYGYWNDDTLHGGNGDDKLFGGDGNDVLQGDAGSDSLSGELGDDILWGGVGKDVMSGGAGHDTFVFKEIDIADVLTDFNPAEDHLDVSALLGAGGTAYLAAAGAHTGLYVDADGAGPAHGVLVATFEGSSLVPHVLTDVLV